MQRKLFISLVAGILLSVSALYLAFRNVPFADLATYIGTIDYFWLFPTTFLIISTFFLRVWRWQLILKGYQKVDFWQAFHPLMIGFMMNCILPGRVGELARPTILRQKQKIPLTTGLATVATERLFDILFLIILFALVFGTIARRPDLEVSFGSLRLNSQTLQSIAWTMIRLILILFIGLFVIMVPWTRQRMITAIMYCTRQISGRASGIGIKIERIATLMIDIIQNIAAGLNLVRHPSRLLACLGFTTAIWGVTLVSYYVFAKGCPGISLTIKELATVMVVICFFIALPSVPGFWGLWEAGGVFALSLFNIPAKDAVGFILVNHAVQLVPVILIGWISAIITSINVWQLFTKNGSKTVIEPSSAQC